MCLECCDGPTRAIAAAAAGAAPLQTEISPNLAPWAPTSPDRAGGALRCHSGCKIFFRRDWPRAPRWARQGHGSRSSRRGATENGDIAKSGAWAHPRPTGLGRRTRCHSGCRTAFAKDLPRAAGRGGAPPPGHWQKETARIPFPGIHPISHSPRSDFPFFFPKSAGPKRAPEEMLCKQGSRAL